MTTIRILLVDDHELVRRNIRDFLAPEPDLDVVSEASSAYEAVRKAEACQPDVVLLDIGIPELNGLQAAPLIKKVAPNTELLFVTAYDNPSFVREAFAAGARGFLSKIDIGYDLVSAIRMVHLKRQFVSRSLTNLATNVALQQQSLTKPSASSD